MCLFIWLVNLPLQSQWRLPRRKGLGLVLCDPNVCDFALAGVVPRLSVHEQAGGVFSDGWELELWRTTGRIEDT